MLIRRVDHDGPQRMRLHRRSAQAGLLLLKVLLPVLLLAGCGGSPTRDVRLADVPGAKPKVEPKAKLGNMDSYVVFGKTYRPKPTSRDFVERGIASWYGPKFHGKKTSSGERYDMHQWTAAHKTLPLPSYVLVTNLENGRSLIVKVNDRGPFVGDRIIDLSYAAAKELGVDKKGTALVQVTSIDPRDHDGKLPKKLKLADAAGQREHSSASGDERAQDGSGRARPARVAASRQPEAGRTTPAPDRERMSPVSRSPVARPAATATSRPPAQPAVASRGAGYYLQVGAFGTRANAEQMRRRLLGQLAAPVSIADDRVPSGGAKPLFRVRVGPVGSRADAEHLAGELAALGVGPSMVVPH